MTRDEALTGLKAGRKLRCDRRDEPLLPWLLKLAADGQLKQEFYEFPTQQYSFLEFTATETLKGD